MVEVRYRRKRATIEGDYAKLVIRDRQQFTTRPVMGVDYMPWEHSVERWHAA